MDPEGIVAVLAGQILEAKARSCRARSEGEELPAIESIGRSLRRTLGCIVQGRDPRQLAATEAVLVVKASGEIAVNCGERTLPLASASLLGLLAEAGVRPEPGQVILLDPVLGAMLVEKAFAGP